MRIFEKGDMHNIVTSGVGVYGPNMRVATKAKSVRSKCISILNLMLLESLKAFFL